MVLCASHFVFQRSCNPTFQTNGKRYAAVKIIKVLYSLGELKLESIPSRWKPRTYNFEKLLEFISKCQQLKIVELSNKVMNGERVHPILIVLRTYAVETIQEIKFQGVNWYLDIDKINLV